MEHFVGRRVQIVLICAIAIFHVIVHRVDHLIVKEKGRLKELRDTLVSRMVSLNFMLCTVTFYANPAHNFSPPPPNISNAFVGKAAFSSAVERTRLAQLYIDAQEGISPSRKSEAVEEHLRMNASPRSPSNGGRSAWIKTPLSERLSKQASSPMGIIEAGVEMETLNAAKRDTLGRALLAPRLAPGTFFFLSTQTVPLRYET